MNYYIIKSRNLQNNDEVYITFFGKIFIHSLGRVTDNRAVWDAMVLWKNPEHCFFNKHFDSLCRGEYN